MSERQISKLNKKPISIMQIDETIRRIRDELACVDLKVVGKRCTRVVSHGVAKSAKFSHQVYPMVLDVQQDGAFSSATYPSRVPGDKLKDVAVMLSHANYRARYGKFAIDFNSREVKFRVFRSAVDIANTTEDSCRILRALPVQMMDQISQTIDGIIAGRKTGLSEVKKLICGYESGRARNKKSRKVSRVESVKKRS